jgi:hypothetical protein
VAFHALDMRNEPHPAGVALLSGVVKPLGHG